MADRTLLRIGAVLAIVGAIAFIVGNLLTIGGGGDPADTAAVLQEAVESTTSVGGRLLIFVGNVLVVGALVALYRSITEGTGAALARLGLASALLALAVFMVVIGINGFAGKEVAEAWVNAPADEKAAAFRVAEAVQHMVVGVISLGSVLYGTAILLYGLAVALSSIYPRWLGWVAVVVGLDGAVAGFSIFLYGASFGTLLPFLLFSLLSILWVLVMGVLMWRRASAAPSAMVGEAIR